MRRDTHTHTHTDTGTYVLRRARACVRSLSFACRKPHPVVCLHALLRTVWWWLRVVQRREVQFTASVQEFFHKDKYLSEAAFKPKVDTDTHTHTHKRRDTGRSAAIADLACGMAAFHEICAHESTDDQSFHCMQMQLLRVCYYAYMVFKALCVCVCVCVCVCMQVEQLLTDFEAAVGKKTQ